MSALVLGVGAAIGAERLALTWSAPSGCPGADDVKVEVDRLLGGSRAQPSKAIAATCAVSKDDHGTWHLRLETPAGESTRTREIHGASCKAVTDAAALVLALMIDPDAVSAGPAATTSAPALSPSNPSSSGAGSGEPESGASAQGSNPVPTAAPTGAVQTTPLPTASLPTAPLPTVAVQTASLPTTPLPTASLRAPKTPVPPQKSADPPARLPISLRAFGWGGADAGSLPGVSGGVGGGVALVLGRQRIELGVAVRLPAKATLPSRPTAGGSVDLIAGALGTCRTLLTGAFEIAPCVAVEAGRIRAEGFGVTSPSSAEQPWIAASGGGLFTLWLVGQLGLTARIDAVVPLARSTFVLEGLGPVHTPSPVSGRASLGAELRF